MNLPLHRESSLESQLVGDEDIADAVSFRSADGLAVVAVVPTDFCTAVDIRDRVRERLDGEELPDRVIVVPAFPRDEDGSIQVDRIVDEPEAMAAGFAAPGTPTEISLSELWCETLDRGWVGADDAFGDLGGDSMSALVLLDLIGERLGVEVTFDDLLGTSSLRSLAELVDQRR